MWQGAGKRRMSAVPHPVSAQRQAWLRAEPGTMGADRGGADGAWRAAPWSAHGAGWARWRPEIESTPGGADKQAERLPAVGAGRWAVGWAAGAMIRKHDPVAAIAMNAAL